MIERLQMIKSFENEYLEFVLLVVNKVYASSQTTT